MDLPALLFLVVGFESDAVRMDSVPYRLPVGWLPAGNHGRRCRRRRRRYASPTAQSEQASPRCLARPARDCSSRKKGARTEPKAEHIPARLRLSLLRSTFGAVSSTVSRQNFATKLPEAISNHRVTFQPHDFFTAQPCKGPEYIYMLRWIVHDYKDEKSIGTSISDASGGAS